ncbi:MAG: dihydroorotate dehydrogenase electron transfer subunit [Gemmiger sp.]|uniref:dihydroorotate dehydrogenase electron transfer subunit n=1 Tax=Gemmiger sp. TaxID=2049027 RepID=UPI002E7A55A4|nr:dihydroorotate dehydrogenase electron transfer subunit [Gemmiger sp.]MEE0800100.1 dihydroorotate dehydrogenase electron transfer subunit [Gemmiger sp.]
MSAISCKTEVLDRKVLTEDIRSLTVDWSFEDHEPHAGQFFMLRAWAPNETPILSRPISVRDYDPETGRLTFLYQVKGEGTRKLAALEPGDELTVTGPCGNGFDAAAADKAADTKGIAVVGGGIGTAPLLQLCKELAQLACRPDLYCGFRDEPYGLDEFLPYCRTINIATDSGAVGYHGLVTGILHPEQYAMVLTCGPTVMMRGVYKLCAEHGVPCYASLERKMACGLGACLGCTCQTKVGPKTVCRDGPVFPAEEVFD